MTILDLKFSSLKNKSLVIIENYEFSYLDNIKTNTNCKSFEKINDLHNYLKSIPDNYTYDIFSLDNKLLPQFDYNEHPTDYSWFLMQNVDKHGTHLLNNKDVDYSQYIKPLNEILDVPFEIDTVDNNKTSNKMNILDYPLPLLDNENFIILSSDKRHGDLLNYGETFETKESLNNYIEQIADERNFKIYSINKDSIPNPDYFVGEPSDQYTLHLDIVANNEGKKLYDSIFMDIINDSLNSIVAHYPDSFANQIIKMAIDDNILVKNENFKLDANDIGDFGRINANDIPQNSHLRLMIDESKINFSDSFLINKYIDFDNDWNKREDNIEKFKNHLIESDSLVIHYDSNIFYKHCKGDTSEYIDEFIKDNKPVYDISNCKLLDNCEQLIDKAIITFSNNPGISTFLEYLDDKSFPFETTQYKPLLSFIENELKSNGYDGFIMSSTIDFPYNENSRYIFNQDKLISKGEINEYINELYNNQSFKLNADVKPQESHLNIKEDYIEKYKNLLLEKNDSLVVHYDNNFFYKPNEGDISNNINDFIKNNQSVYDTSNCRLMTDCEQLIDKAIIEFSNNSEISHFLDCIVNKYLERVEDLRFPNETTEHKPLLNFIEKELINKGFDGFTMYNSIDWPYFENSRYIFNQDKLISKGTINEHINELYNNQSHLNINTNNLNTMENKKENSEEVKKSDKLLFLTGNARTQHGKDNKEPFYPFSIDMRALAVAKKDDKLKRAFVKNKETGEIHVKLALAPKNAVDSYNNTHIVGLNPFFTEGINYKNSVVLFDVKESSLLKNITKEHFAQMVLSSVNKEKYPNIEYDYYVKGNSPDREKNVVKKPGEYTPYDGIGYKSDTQEKKNELANKIDHRIQRDILGTIKIESVAPKANAVNQFEPFQKFNVDFQKTPLNNAIDKISNLKTSKGNPLPLYLKAIKRHDDPSLYAIYKTDVIKDPFALFEIEGKAEKFLKLINESSDKNLAPATITFKKPENILDNKANMYLKDNKGNIIADVWDKNGMIEKDKSKYMVKEDDVKQFVEPDKSKATEKAADKSIEKPKETAKKSSAQKETPKSAKAETKPAKSSKKGVEF